MFVGAPFGEARQPGQHTVAVGVEDVRAVAVQDDAVGVRPVVGVAGDMVARLDDLDPESGIGQLAGGDGAGEAGSHDQDRTHVQMPGSGQVRSLNKRPRSPSSKYRR